MTNVNSTREQNIELWKSQMNELQNLIIEANNKYIVSVRVNCGGLCPYLAFIRLDCLNKEDYPNNISDNSIFMDFKFDLIAHKIEISRYGHVYLSEKDLATDKYKYLCMKSIVNIATDYGVCKKFRKCSYKSMEQAAKKILDYFNVVMEATEKYTGGYPYKQGIEKA